MTDTGPAIGMPKFTLASKGFSRADILAWLREDDPARLE